MLDAQGRDAPTYYDRPLLKPPHWEWNVVTYLFMGGIMGGLGFLQFLADERRAEHRVMRRTARVASLVLAAANPAVLITHLGRPERFLNMLRILKVKSPMSLGVWGLVAYSGAASANVLEELVDAGALPGTLRRAVPPLMREAQTLLGAFVSGYTGVLLSATANPLWASGKRHLPAAFVCSGVASACALTSLLCLMQGDDGANDEIERLEMAAGGLELLVLTDFERHAGAYARALFNGERGKRLRAVTMLWGTLAPLLSNAFAAVVPLPRSIRRARTALGSLLTLAGGYVLRESVIEAGKDAARDPRLAFRQPD